jgi:hypothetical protein
MNETGPVREILDENGDLLYRVREENPGTVFAVLVCESRTETRHCLEYPERWHRLSDKKLYALCKSGEIIL